MAIREILDSDLTARQACERAGLRLEEADDGKHVWLDDVRILTNTSGWHAFELLHIWALAEEMGIAVTGPVLRELYGKCHDIDWKPGWDDEASQEIAAWWALHGGES